MQVIEKNQTIGLVGMEFYAYHGFYEEEQKIGGTYFVDVFVSYSSNKQSDDDIKNIVNYETIFEIVKNRMQISSKLIEHLAEEIIFQLKQTLGEDKKIKVCIKKKRPPLNGIIDFAVFEIEF